MNSIILSFQGIKKVSQMSVFCLKRDSLAKKWEMRGESCIDYQRIMVP